MSDRGRIRWWKSGASEGPGSAASPTTIGRPGSIVEAETSDAWRELARRFDLLPTTVDASSPKDDAVGLLRLAAEVEHALMVQYLYAAVSLADDPDARQKLLAVAIQEMDHLLSLQNLLIALDGPAGIYLGRDHLRLSSVFNPLPLDFEPVGELALAKFVVVEAPEVFGRCDAARACALARSAGGGGAGARPETRGRHLRHPRHPVPARWLTPAVASPAGGLRG